MAAPGYPNMGGQMPMGGPPMGGPPMGAAPMQRPIRRGTSKAVPVVVSAGLAVGVFCGLLFGVGTGQKKADAAPSVASNVKKDDESNKNAAPEGLGATPTTPAKPATPPTTPTTPAAGSAAVPTVQTPTTPTTPAKPAEKMVKVVIKVVPDTAQKDAKITVDGTEITGNETDIPLSKKSVKIVIKTDGYRTAEKKLDLIDGDQMTVELPLTKRPTGGGGGGVHAPKRPDRPPSNSGGGLIDI